MIDTPCLLWYSSVNVSAHDAFTYSEQLSSNPISPWDPNWLLSWLNSCLVLRPSFSGHLHTPPSHSSPFAASLLIAGA